MTLKVFNGTHLVELPTDDSYVPLVIDDSVFDDAGLYIMGYKSDYKPTYQAISALDATVWVNSFRQKPGLASLSGVLVSTNCPGGSIDRRRAAFVRMYRKYKITAAVAPLKIAFHDIVMTGYFDQLTFSNGNLPKSLAFEMTFYGLPISLLNANELAPVKSPGGSGGFSSSGSSGSSAYNHPGLSGGDIAAIRERSRNPSVAGREYYT